MERLDVFESLGEIGDLRLLLVAPAFPLQVFHIKGGTQGLLVEVLDLLERLAGSPVHFG